MSSPAGLREQLRPLLQQVDPNDPATIEAALSRIIEIIDPFENAAALELERYRATFAELAK